MFIGCPHCVAGKRVRPGLSPDGHNSGVIHAGVYYTPGSLKAQFAWRETAPPKPFAIKTTFAIQLRQDAGRHVRSRNGTDARVWERTAANGIEREWLNAEELASANRISPGSAAFLCRPAAFQLPRRDGGDGKNLPVQRR